MDYIDDFLFGVFPYICMVVFFLGSWARFDRSQYTWRAQSSQLLRRKQLVWGSILFHVGILGLFFGHFFGLLRSEEHTSELQSLMRISYAVFCLKNKTH